MSMIGVENKTTGSEADCAISAWAQPDLKEIDCEPAQPYRTEHGTSSGTAL